MQGWEFDIRRLCDGVLADDLSVSNMAETALSGQLQRISNALREVFTDCTVNFGFLDKSTMGHPVLTSFSGDNCSMTGSREEGSQSIARSVYSEANVLNFDDEVIGEVWEAFCPQIMDAVKAFFQALNLRAEITADVESYLQSSFFSVFVAGIRQLQAFDWRRWWEKRDFILAILDRSIVNNMVAEAEELMFAPIYTSIADRPTVENCDQNRTLGETGALVQSLSDAAAQIDWLTLVDLITQQS